MILRVSRTEIDGGVPFSGNRRIWKLAATIGRPSFLSFTTTSYPTRQDVPFYVEAARESGGPVLELGCGTGRVLIPTARAGIETVGFDLSAGMLEACQRRLRAEPPELRDRVSLHRGDMRNFDLGRTFRLVTIPFRPFRG